MVSVNFLGVIIAAIVSMFIGFLWYGPLFGNNWMKLSGIDKKKLNQMKKKGMGKTYLFAFISALVTAYVLATFVNVFGATTISSGLVVGFWTWLGLVATVTLGMVLWEGKSMNLYLLHNGYNLINISVMASILAVLG